MTFRGDGGLHVGRRCPDAAPCPNEVLHVGEPAGAQPLPPGRPEPSERVIRLAGPIGRGEVTAVARRARNDLIRCGPGIVRCDVEAVDESTLPTVDVLARLALAARRGRSEMRLEHASPAILELLELCGLAEVLRCDAPGDPPGESDADDSGGEVRR
jgi:ABC-type transporter Mla MlaB component